MKLAPLFGARNGVAAFLAFCVLLAGTRGAAAVEYQLTVRNDWSQAHHKPGAPAFDTVIQPHFSHLGGGTHNDDLVVWEVGQLSSRGMVKMQETGWIDEPGTRNDLENEFASHISAGTAASFLNYPIPNPWFPAGTETVLTFEIEESHPLVTLVSMLGPSPDWFVGVAGLDLRDGPLWKELVEIDLYPYDGGSRSRDDEFRLFGDLEDPQLPIREITDDDDTLLLGSIPIGKFTFELLTPQALMGDSNGDGVVNTLDINPFVLALTDENQYAIDFPDVPMMAANDANNDGFLNTLDINPFVALLTGSASAAPEPSAFLLISSIGGVFSMRRRRPR